MKAEIPAHLQEDLMAEDLLEGASSIANYLWGKPHKRRKVYHLARTSRLPIFRFGGVLHARKSKLNAWIEAQENKNWTRC